MNVIDQLSRHISIRSRPERIISLVPSQTELLFDLGMGDRVVGVTKFCVHPSEALATRNIIGGTKTVDLESVKAIQPDLILANKEENELQTITALEKLFPVWVSDVTDQLSALQMIEAMGSILECQSKALELANQIRDNFQRIRKHNNQKALYLIWKKPWMAAGNDTFIHAMLSEMGLKNAVENNRYPTLTKEDIISLNPNVVMLSSEPYPFQEKHVLEIQSWLPNANVLQVDGEMFSWYGSRMRLAPDYFNSLSL